MLLGFTPSPAESRKRKSDLFSFDLRKAGCELIAKLRVKSVSLPTSARVLLAVDMNLLSDALKTCLAAQPNIEVVGEVSDPTSLILAVGQAKANVVIHCWPSTGEMPGVCTHLLAAFPDLTVIGLGIDGERNQVAFRPIVVEPLPAEGLDGVLNVLHEIVKDFVDP